MANSTLEYEQNKEPLNLIQYSSKDFPSYFDSLLARIKDAYGDDYNDFASSSVGMLLVHVMSYGLSQLAWYQDRIASDSFLETARSYDAVNRLARQIGYKPKPASASTVDVTVNFSVATPADGIIHKGFLFQGPAGLTFYSTADVLVAAGSTSVAVNLSEGVIQEETFTGSGIANQKQDMPIAETNAYMGDLSVRAYVNGQEWVENPFIDFEKTNQFEVSYFSDPPYILFGDGQAGNMPPNGSDIRVTYRVIHGANGNVKSGTIEKALDPFMINGVDHTISSVSQLNSSSGGSEPESLESIKKLAPKVFQTTGSAVTKQDYYSLVNSFSDATYGSVSKGAAAVVRDSGTDQTTIQLINKITNAIADFNAVFLVEQGVFTTASTNADSSNDLAKQYSEAVYNSSTGTGYTISVDGSANTIGTTAASGLVRELIKNGNGAAGIVGSTGIVPSLIAGLNALIDGSGATDAQKTAMKAMTSDINSQSIDAGVKASTCAQLAIQVQGHASDVVNTSTLMKSSMTQCQVQIDATSLDLSTIGISLTNLSAAGVTANSEIATNAEKLSTYLSGLFSAACKANLVRVPILVKDNTGFYTGPSTGLVKAVQAYLDGIKEVTHQVMVESGEYWLQGAIVLVKARFWATYVQSEVKANIESGIDAMLKDRDFGSSLYLSDLYNMVEGIAGIEYINIAISGPATHIDSEGNLIVSELEIVTKGSVSVEVL